MILGRCRVCGRLQPLVRGTVRDHLPPLGVEADEATRPWCSGGRQAPDAIDPYEKSR